MESLVTGNVWAQFSRIIGKKKVGQKRAAIAYVSSEHHLKFGGGDLLICDASDQAIRSGETSARALIRFDNDGALLYSCPGLHAKVLVSGRVALVGSANLSHSSATNLIEIALATDRQAIVSPALAFIEQLKRKSQKIDRAFLTRIAKIKVERRAFSYRRRKLSVKRLGDRTWLISTRPLDDERYREEEVAAKRGIQAAARVVGVSEDDITWVRWTGKSRFASEAKEGDTIINIWAAGPKRAKYKVYQPCTILKKQCGNGWTRFYYQDSGKYSSWKHFSREAKRFGMRRIAKTSTRELSAREALLLETLWR